MDTCSADFERLAAQAGGIDCRNAGLITLQNPFSLHHPTMLIIEVALIAGAAAGLVHALRIRREHGVSTNLIVWWASTLCPLLLEPVVYFPRTFGLQEVAGLTFIHNQFTVQFLFNRLPLYIIAMYPAFTYVGFLVVQRAGARAVGPFLGGCGAAFTFVSLWEIIGQVGPQLRWWVWNYDAKYGLPTLGSEPMSSVTGFSIGVPLGVVWLALRATRDDHDRVVVKTLWITVGSIVVMSILMLPMQLAALVVDQHAATTVGTIVTVGLCGIATAWLFRPAFDRRVPAVSETFGDPSGRFLHVVFGGYLLVAAVVWAVALPAGRGAVDGIAPDGGPVGSFPVALASAAMSVLLVVASQRIVGRSLRSSPDGRGSVGPDTLTATGSR